MRRGGSGKVGRGAPAGGAGERGFLPRVEALRGIAALLVAAFHSGLAPIQVDGIVVGQLSQAVDGVSPWWNGMAVLYGVLADGPAAVTLFFVISGFVLRLSLERAGQGIPSVRTVASIRSVGRDRSGASARAFFVRRAFRLFPAMFAMVAIFAVVYHLTGAGFAAAEPEQYSAAGLLRHALLLRTAINAVAWTLQLEVLAAFLIFAAYLLALRFGDAVVVALALLLGLASFSTSWAGLLAPHGGPPLGPLHAFPVGMLIPGIGRRLGSRWGAATGRWGALAVAGVAILLLARPVLDPEPAWKVIAEVLGAAALLVVVAYGPDGRAARVLDGRGLRFFGRISYSFYLLHPLSLLVLWSLPDPLGALVGRGIPPVALAVAGFVLSTAAVTPLAAVVYRFVERPGIAVGRRLGGAEIPGRRESATSTRAGSGR